MNLQRRHIILLALTDISCAPCGIVIEPWGGNGTGVAFGL